MTSEEQRIAKAFRGYAKAQAGEGRWSQANRGNRQSLEERQIATRRLLEERRLVPLANTNVLEVGCGTGGELNRLLELGADPAKLVGVDLVEERVAAGRARFPQLDLRVMNAEHLEFADGQFGLVMAITILSSILDEGMARRVAREITRVIKPGGFLLWYDFRYGNPRNPDVRAITESEFRSLFPSLHGELHTITLLPPLARRLGPATRVAYPLLSALPGLRTHLLGLLQKPPSPPSPRLGRGLG